eukprot:Tbor_TRINITY_DN5609_c3_g1::TRINITY_DN5609_c3_g1_i1::g.9549::m.9549
MGSRTVISRSVTSIAHSVLPRPYAHHILATALTTSSCSSTQRGTNNTINNINNIINNNTPVTAPIPSYVHAHSSCTTHCHIYMTPAPHTTIPYIHHLINNNNTNNTQRRHFFSDNSKNPYTILGIKHGASKADIKKAYRVMAAKHHPDAPGGSNDKFQELQAAYDEIKTGVWIPKDGGGSGGGDRASGGRSNKYDGFQWYTDGKRGSKKSYEKMQQEMHTGETRRSDFDDDEDLDNNNKDKGKKINNNPMGASDMMMAAWFRLISLWTGVFVICRVVLFFTFPPRHQPLQRKPLPKAPRRPPPPKPVQHSPMSA